MRTEVGWSTFLAIVWMGACAPQSPEQQTIADAAAAMGGKEAIEAVTSIVIEGEGTQWNPGQDMTPDATSQTFTISDYKYSMDLAGGRARVELTRTPDFNYFRGPDPMKRGIGLDGDVAYILAPDGSASRAPDALAKDLKADAYHHALTIVRAALDPGATLSNARTEGGENLIDVMTADGVSLTLATDANTNLPSSVMSTTNHANLQDVDSRTVFDDYQEVDGLNLPSSITEWTHDLKLRELRVTQSVNADVGDLSAPEAVHSAAPVTGPAPAEVTAEEVAEGIWLLAGQSHHSVLVEFSDHLTLIEAPNEVRTLAVIAKARELIPDKPVTHLVNTHHHFDHSGGVRAAISEGLTIVTHDANATFYEELAERPSTIQPDALARNPQEATIEAVEAEATYEDESMEMVLYHIAGNPHGDGLLMAYFPKQRILVEADAFSPGRDYQPFAANLLENIEPLNLSVDRIVPIHGNVVSIDELRSSVRAMTE